jgi:hypothetical protein
LPAQGQGHPANQQAAAQTPRHAHTANPCPVCAEPRRRCRCRCRSVTGRACVRPYASLTTCLDSYGRRHIRQTSAPASTGSLLASCFTKISAGHGAPPTHQQAPTLFPLPFAGGMEDPSPLWSGTLRCAVLTAQLQVPAIVQRTGDESWGRATSTPTAGATPVASRYQANSLHFQVVLHAPPLRAPFARFATCPYRASHASRNPRP